MESEACFAETTVEEGEMCVHAVRPRQGTSVVFEEVQTCCAALSERLGQQSYFFGDKPTELDALTFGHLYSLMTTDLVDGRLGQIVSGFGNLVDLCHRVESQYFADS
ncbi:unnamed protein product [Ixodes pacificus]